jgi:hypothetical protein
VIFAGAHCRAVGHNAHSRIVGYRLASIAPKTIPMAAWVSRSPPYTSPRGLRTEISTINYAVIDPQWLFRFSRMPHENYPQIFACLGMV